MSQKSTSEIAKEIIGQWGYEEPYWWEPIRIALDAERALRLEAEAKLEKETLSISAKISETIYISKLLVENKQLTSKLSEAKKDAKAVIDYSMKMQEKIKELEASLQALQASSTPKVDAPSLTTLGEATK